MIEICAFESCVFIFTKTRSFFPNYVTSQYEYSLFFLSFFFSIPSVSFHLRPFPSLSFLVVTGVTKRRRLFSPLSLPTPTPVLALHSHRERTSAVSSPAHSHRIELHTQHTAHPSVGAW